MIWLKTLYKCMERLRDQHERVGKMDKEVGLSLSISFLFQTPSWMDLFRRIFIRKSTHVCCFFCHVCPWIIPGFSPAVARLLKMVGYYPSSNTPSLFRGTAEGRLPMGDGGADVDVALVFVDVLQGIETFVHNTKPEKPRDAKKRLWTRRHRNIIPRQATLLQVRSSAATGPLRPRREDRSAPRSGEARVLRCRTLLLLSVPTLRKLQRLSTWSILLVVTHTRKHDHS